MRSLVLTLISLGISTLRIEPTCAVYTEYQNSSMPRHADGTATTRLRPTLLLASRVRRVHLLQCSDRPLDGSEVENSQSDARALVPIEASIELRVMRVQPK